MTTSKVVISEIEYLLSFKTIMETYEEIAATRMQRIRSSVLQSRDFLFEINTIFQQVKSSYRIKGQGRFLNNNGKTLFIFVSANTGLYGDIIRRTFELFVQHLKKERADVAIIGRLGLKLFQEEFGKKPFSYFDLSDNKIDIEDLKKIVLYLIQYEKVLVFYEQFQNIISYQPIITSIAGDTSPWEPKVSETKYFFEPSLEKVMAFFEKEIFASIFDQTIYESQLAKFSSRMVSLDRATENTQSQLKQAMFAKERIRHQAINKEQNQRLASMSLWITH